MLNRLLPLAVLCVCFLQAQDYRATIIGRVTDPSGAAVPDVSITATKLDTNSKSTTVADAEGLYTIPLLTPGIYQVEAGAAGFKSFVQQGIDLGSGARVAVPIVLVVGSTSEVMNVTADAPPLQTETASSGQVITTREVENLPLNGRSPMDLAKMAYGVVNTGNRDQNRPYENAGFSDFAMGGGASGANEALLDGVPNIGTLGTTGRRAAFSPPVDSVSEVKVDVFNVDASYGGAGGGTVEIITKGGTNDLHGSLYEFNQVSNLTATPFFTNSSGSKKTIFRQNTWGITAGGPLFVPKVFDGRNKLFWFFTYEGHRNSEPLPTFITVPTADQRKGDFSALLNLGSNYQLFDPATATLANGAVSRKPFSGNIIPRDRLNPVALKYLDFIPLPNVAGNADGTNNFFAGLTNENKYYSFSGRLDANLGAKDKISGNIRQSLWQQDAGNVFKNVAFGQSGLRGIWGATADGTHTFSPTMLGNLRLGFTRYRAYYVNNSDGFDPTTLGFPSYIAANATRQVIPQFTFSDGFLVASPVINVNTTDQPYNTYQLFGSLTKIAGAHTLKAGGEHRVFDYSNIAWTGATGSYTFDNTWVKATSGAAGAPVGGSLASFLLGLPVNSSTSNYTVNAASKNDSNYEVLFVQDDWHARTNLTLNIGLRWEYNSPSVERWNRQIVGFDPAATNQTTAAAILAYGKAPVAQLPANQFQPTGGLLFADPNHRTATTTPTTDFSPRFGVSWSPAALKSRTVIRAGFGLFNYVYGVMLSQQPGFSLSTPYVATNDSYLSAAATLSDPFPASNPIVQPFGSSRGVNTNLGQSVTFLNPHLQRQYSLRWTFDVQHQLAANTILQAGYVGNHSVHLTTNYNFGSLPAQYLSTSGSRDQATISALASVVSNPFVGLLPGALNSSTTSVSNLLRPFPEFTGVTEQNLNNGGSYFHELGVRVFQRLSHGLVLSLNYSHSRLMESISYLNGGSPLLEKRVSSSDRPNNFSLSAVYELPVGRGKTFLSGSKRAMNTLLGDWAISSLYTYHSGAPLPWGNLIYYWGDLHFDARNVNHAFDTAQFNTASAQQLSQNFRTLPSQFNNIRLDATNNLNASVTKNFSLYERVRLQFRADSFNVMNHPLFGAPNVVPTNKAFGTVSTQTNNPRVIQGALRLTF